MGAATEYECCERLAAEETSMTQVTIGKSGDDLAVRLPRDVVQAVTLPSAASGRVSAGSPMDALP
jgi:hypothetical protein